MGIWDDFSLDESGDKKSIWSDFSLDLKEQNPVQQASGLEKVFDVPSAAIRGVLQGRGYAESAANFKGVPRFQDLALDKYYKSDILKDSPMLKGAVGMIPSAAGFAADVATNPAEGIISLAGGKGLEMMAKAGKSLGAPFKLRAIGNQAREMEKVAQRAIAGTAQARKIINARYSNEIGSAFQSAIPSIDFNNITRSALRVINDAPDIGTSIPQFERAFDAIANARTLGDLHEVKSGIGGLMSSARSKPQRDALKQLYSTLSSSLEGNASKLASGKNFGQVYSSITKEFDNFTNRVGNVVSTVSQRKYGSGRPMPSGEKLSKGALSKPEVKRAFQELEGYFPKRTPFSQSGAGQNLIGDINAINRSGIGALTNKALQATTGVSGPMIAYLLWKKMKEDRSDRSDYSGNAGSN